MNQENIKRRLIALRSFSKVVITKIKYKSIIASEVIIRSLRKLLTKIRNNKKKISIGVATACVFVICGVSLINGLTAYEYSYNGQTLGIVTEEESVYDGIEEAEQTLTKEVGAKVVIDKEKDIKVEKVVRNIVAAATDEAGDETEVVDALTSIDNIKVVTYSINITDTVEDNPSGVTSQAITKESDEATPHAIDNKSDEVTTHAIYLDTEEHAQNVLDSVKAKFTQDIPKGELVEASFDESVTISEGEAFIEDIVTTKAAFNTIMTGGIKEKVHRVKEGESVAYISVKYNIDKKQLRKWNPSIKADEIIYPNQKIQLRERIPLLNVVTKRNTVITEVYDADIKYVDTDKLYKGMEKVIKKGKSGNHTVNADIIERNGKQIDRTALSEVVHKQPVAQVVMRGTKERPKEIGAGHYFYPMNGKFSSPFGPRWGRIHKGIDISGPEGTDIFAADAGVVVEAGDTSNGYGLAIKIDHGNGRATYYAHNSKALVKVGDIVFRGQHIAESGNTGSSTGPHLHFETRFNEVAKDPQKYL
jgi:murein DD-endopeptidase MepM/ murein hydrolase activator NlpD